MGRHVGFPRVLTSLASGAVQSAAGGEVLWALAAGNRKVDEIIARASGDAKHFIQRAPLTYIQALTP